ncbi:MAG TPA: vitamin K epoxide reductase family protein [Anaeromyxobacteraceae bacterium]|nr:vitamin K epoxide reductase family protein [Anaeromyxobacteraceae bacterium]
MNTSRRPAEPREAELAPGRGGLWLLLALGLAGLALALALTRLHEQAHAGVKSFCALNEVVNCDRVAVSRYSVWLGLPVAVWGAFGYALASGLAAWGLWPRRPNPSWPKGFLVLFGALAVAVSIALALVSEFAIGAVCLLCMGSWLVALAILVAAWRSARRPGVLAAIRADLGTVLAHPAMTLLAAAVALAIAVSAAAAYPRYWEKPPPPAPPAAAEAPARPLAPGDKLTIVEYSDYECPFCARDHELSRPLFADRPDLVVIHRQFPLDPTCNPAVKRPMHPAACELARAAICADEQGRFADMDDALFRNQKEQLPVEALATRLGLDLKSFKECMVSNRSAQRLAAEIEKGIADKVRATPSYVVNGKTYDGQLPPGLIPPRP